MQDKLLATLLFVAFMLLQHGSLHAQPVSSMSGSVEEPLSAQQKASLDQRSFDQAPVGPDDCETKFAYPISKNADPYAENGAEICKKLVIRGQRMQCEIDSLVEDSSIHATTGAKIQVAAWARCNAKIASLLVNGYYLAASEIERRLQICSSNFYADPGKMPKAGLYQRFMKWMTSNDLTPPPSDQALELAIKQSVPLEVSQESAGLMRCEWMYSRSKTPVINPLPGSSDGQSTEALPAKPPSPKSTVKKAVKKPAS